MVKFLSCAHHTTYKCHCSAYSNSAELHKIFLVHWIIFNIKLLYLSAVEALCVPIFYNVVMLECGVPRRMCCVQTAWNQPVSMLLEWTETEAYRIV